MKFALVVLALIGSALALPALDLPTFEIKESELSFDSDFPNFEINESELDIPEFPEIPEFPKFPENTDDEIASESVVSNTDYFMNLANSTDDDKIIGGTPTRIEMVPWLASFRQNNRHICGCSLISLTRSLTAAHCVNLNMPTAVYTVMAGSTMRTGDNNAVISRVQRLIPHQQYNRRTLQNDICVIHLQNAFPLRAGIRPISLAGPTASIPYGAKCFVAGWGLTAEGGQPSNTVKAVQLPLMTNDQCNIAYRNCITQDMVCAGFPQGGRDACQGDSGGPMAVNGVQHGVVSWGNGCARPNAPGVYARVAHFAHWIRANV